MKVVIIVTSRVHSLLLTVHKSVPDAGRKYSLYPQLCTVCTIKVLKLLCTDTALFCLKKNQAEITFPENDYDSTTTSPSFAFV